MKPVEDLILKRCPLIIERREKEEYVRFKCRLAKLAKLYEEACTMYDTIVCPTYHLRRKGDK